MRLTSILCAALLLPASAATGQSPLTTQSSAVETARTVHYELREGNRLVGAPSLPLQIGRTTAVSIGGAYALRLRVDRAAPDGGAPAYLVRSSLARAANGERLFTPDITVVEGLPTRIDLAALDLSIGVTIR